MNANGIDSPESDLETPLLPNYQDASAIDQRYGLIHVGGRVRGGDNARGRFGGDDASVSEDISGGEGCSGGRGDDEALGGLGGDNAFCDGDTSEGEGNCSGCEDDEVSGGFGDDDASISGDTSAGEGGSGRCGDGDASGESAGDDASGREGSRQGRQC